MQVIVMLACVAAAAWMLRRSLFGRQLLAVGGNEQAARLSGINTARIKIAVYAISGLLAGVAGLVVIAINSAMALGLRAGSLDIHWGDALPFLVLAIVGTVLGKRIADRVPASKLTTGFVVLLIALAAYTAISSISQLL